MGKDISKGFRPPFLTEKMQMLCEDIIASIIQLPSEQKGYIFGYDGEEDTEWVVAVAEYIIFEYIKYSFDYDDPEYPLSHFFEDGDDSERMLQSRIMQYVLKYKKHELERHGVNISEDKKYANAEMNTLKKKLQGHRVTEMNFFEHQKIHDLDMIKAIVERRIVSSKKISNEKFKEIFEQYDEFVESLIERSRKSDRDMVFSSIALFTLEWHYPVEMMYYLSCIMESEKIKEINPRALSLLCCDVEIKSQFGGWVRTHSRM